MRVSSFATAFLLVAAPVPAAAQQAWHFWDDIFRLEHVPPGGPIPDPASSGPGPKIIHDGRAYFCAFRPSLGRELFWTNATGGDYFLHDPDKGYDDIIPGQVGSNPRDFVLYCGRLFFVADRVIDGNWIEGALQTIGPGTGDVVADYWPVVQDGNVFSKVSELTLCNGELWFSAEGYSDPYLASSRFPWRIHDPFPDQCITEMVQLETPDPARVPEIGEMECAGTGVALTVKYDTVLSNPLREIWLSGGTPASSSKVVGFRYGPYDLRYEPLRGELYFGSFVLDRTYLWRCDLTGNPAGTIQLRHPLGGDDEPSNPAELFVAHGYVYFRADSLACGVELWRTAGTIASTVMVGDLTPGPASSNPFDFRKKDDSVFFLLDSQTPEKDGLYRSPATDPTQTAALKLIPEVRNLTLLPGGLFYFAGDIDNLGQEVWLSKGTRRSTWPVVDANVGTPESHPIWFVRLNNIVIMTATEQEFGDEILMVPYGLFGPRALPRLRQVPSPVVRVPWSSG